MVAINYAKDIRVGEQPAKAVALGSNFVWPPLPERLFFRGQSLAYDFVRQRYGTRLPGHVTIDAGESPIGSGYISEAFATRQGAPDLATGSISAQPLPGIEIEAVLFGATSSASQLAIYFLGDVVSSLDGIRVWVGGVELAGTPDIVDYYPQANITTAAYNNPNMDPWEAGQSYTFAITLDGSEPSTTIDYTTNVNDLGIVTRASTATYWGPEGSLLEAAVDEARIQHDPVTGEALGLLIEESRTNTIPNTDLSTAAAGTTLVTQSVSAKFGEHSYRIETPDETCPRVLYSTAGSGVTGTVRSVAVRAVELDVVRLTVYNFEVTASHDFNLSSGTVDQLNSGNRLVNPTIEDIGDGWFLISAQLGPIASSSYTRLGLRGHKSDGSACVAGDGFEAALPQSESDGSYTSRIPTTDSPVTRAADNVVIDLADVLNPDEGTLRITAQVPEGGVVATLGDIQIVSDSDEKKSYRMTYSGYTGVPTVSLGSGIHSKLEYLPEAQS